MTNSLSIDDFIHFPLARSEARNVFLSPPAASAMTHTGACHWRLGFDSLIFMLSITKTNPVQLQQWVWTDVHTKEKGCYCFFFWVELWCLLVPKTPHICQLFLLLAGQHFLTSLFMLHTDSYESMDTQLAFKKDEWFSFRAVYLCVNKQSKLVSFCCADLFNDSFKWNWVCSSYVGIPLIAGGTLDSIFHGGFGGENPLRHPQAKHCSFLTQKNSQPGCGLTYKFVVENIRLASAPENVGLKLQVS